MDRRLSNLLRIIFVLLDLAVLNIVFLVCHYVFGLTLNSEVEYLLFFFFSNLAWVVSSWLVGIYRDSDIHSFERFSRRTMTAYAYFLALEMLYFFFNKEAELSRLFIISIVVSFLVSLLLNRFLHLALYYFFQSKRYVGRRVLIIGYNDRAKKLVEYLEQEPIRTEIVGFCEHEEAVDELTNYPILCKPQDALEVSKEHNVTEIFSTIAPEQEVALYKLMNQAEQSLIRFKIIPDITHFIRKPVHVDYIYDMPVLSLRKEPLEDIGNRIKKRFFDVVFSSLVILLLLSWLVPLVGLLIWLESRGPIFFVQQRSGKDGKVFNCLKFRSMKVNKDANEKQATKNDARITKLGSFLRKSSIDELPQFFNVWIGDMSIVGPRPHMIRHTDDYSRLINHYMIRHFLKPGITGWAQIHGYRGEIKRVEDIHGRVEYDLWYLENWSLWLDMRIILLTAYNMVRGEKNAY